MKKTEIGHLLAIGSALVLWEILSLLPKLSLLLASPIEVVVRLWQLLGERTFWPTLWYSFARIAAGFGIGLGVGVGLALLAGRMRWVETLLEPYMRAVKSVPVASFVIIVLIFFGASQLSTIISALMVLPLVYTNLLAGIRSLDPQADRMARAFGLSPARRFFYVRLPQLKEYFLSGTSVALGLCWKSGVAAELIGQPAGSVGNRLYLSKIYLETADLFAWTALIVLVSLGLEKLMTFLFRRFFAVWEKIR